MWFSEIGFDGSKAPAGCVAKECGISLYAYPISYYEERSALLVYFACTLYGPEPNKKTFLKTLKKSHLVRYMESNDDFLIVQFEEPLFTKPVYHHNIIHSRPIAISSDGQEIWSVASQRKETLIAFYRVLRRVRNARMLSIKRRKLINVSLAQIHPKLTTKQKNAIKMAIEEGYYRTPRRTSVKDLAKKAGLAFSTYQTHLRKAERKLIPYSFTKIE